MKTIGQQLDGRFTDAVAYAARAHRDQVRKGTHVAYLAHLLSVAALVIEHGGNEAQATAGVLHDVVEDQGGRARLDDVRSRFGGDVADMVDSLSDAAPADGEAKAPWEARKRAYIDRLRDEARAGSPAVLVSACDKLHNAEAIVADAADRDGDPGLRVFDRFTGGANGTAWYYAELAATFRDADVPSRLLARLDAVVERIQGLAADAEDAGGRTIELSDVPTAG